jgi:hypothetical protein
MIERKLYQKWHVPRVLRILITNCLLVIIGGPTFVQPAEESGFAGKHLGKVAATLFGPGSG